MNIYLIVVAVFMVIFALLNWGSASNYPRAKFHKMAYFVYLINYASLANGSAMLVNELVKLLH